MGCSCTTKLHLRNTERDQSLEKNNHNFRESIQLGVTSYAEFINGNMNIVIWSKESDLNLLFPQRYFNYTLSPKASIKFNVTPYIHQSKVIADCLVLITNNLSDKEKVLNICSEYSNVCIKILITLDNPFQIPSSELTTINMVGFFYTELFEQMKNIEKTLKQTFSELDTDQDSLLNLSELKIGLKQLNIGIEPKTAQEYLSEIDLDHDGKISFSEFSYWWKRGRQGGKSLKKVLEKWKFSIENLTPTVEKYLKNSGINKNKIKKNGKIEVGQDEECKLGISLFLGTGSKREEILRAIVNNLNILIYESWVVIKVTYNNEALAKYNLKKTEEMVQSVKLLLLAKLNIGNEIEPGILTKVSKNESDVYITIIFDVGNEIIDRVLELGQFIEEFFKSPTDDFLDLKIVTSKNLAEIDENADFFESFGNGYLLFNCEHWEEYVNILKPKNESERLLQEFFRKNGEIVIKDPKVKELRSLKSYVKMILDPLIGVSKMHPLATKFFKGFNEELVPELEIYARYKNLGVRVSLTDNMLSSLFSI